MDNRITGGIVALAIGDAFGVPVEFLGRAHLLKNPVKDYQSFGTHNQPEGTWSDDTSLTLCTIEGLLKGIDFDNLISTFNTWYTKGHWTATGEVFDIGITTKQALLAYQSGGEALYCGSTDEYSNGNGSLMRILPMAFAVYTFDLDTRRTNIFKASMLTHGHSRSKLAYWLYSEIIRNIILAYTKVESIDNAFNLVNKWIIENHYETEWRHFQNCNSTILTKDVSEIKSTGYVVHSLEESIYSLLKTDSVIDSLLFAVNLGDDSDTTAAITGGLSGTFYGVNSIPEPWITRLQRYGDILQLAQKFTVASYFK